MRKPAIANVWAIDALHSGRGLGRLVVSYLTADVLAAALNLGSTVIVLGALSVEDFGLADLVRVAQWFVASVISLNVFESAARFSFDAEDPEERRRILGGALTVYVLGGCVAAAVFAAIAAFGQRWFGSSFTPGIVAWAAINIPITNLVMALVRTAAIQSNSALYTALVICQASCGFLACWFFVAYMRLGVEGYFIAMVAAGALTGLIGYRASARHYRWGALEGPIRRYISFGAPVTVTETIQYGFGFVVRLLLAASASRSALGWYALAERLQAPLQLVVAAVGRVWIPWVLQEQVGLHHPVQREVRQLSAFVLITVGILIIFLPELIHVLGGARYEGAYAVALLVLIARSLMFFGDYVLWASLTIAKRTHYRIWIYAVAYGTASIVAITAVPRFEALAVGIATLVASATILVGMLLVSRVVHPLEHGILTVIGCSALALTVAIYGSRIALPVPKLAFVGLYLLALRVCGFLPLRIGRTWDRNQVA